jgi:hypothetical protein
MKRQAFAASVALSILAGAAGRGFPIPWRGLAARFHRPAPASRLDVAPVLRLGVFDEAGGRPLFRPVRGTVSPPGNVYFVTHGWAPNLLGQVRELVKRGSDPLAWDATSGLGERWYAELCSAIKASDPGATIFFYSWIDGSATESLDAWNSQSHTDHAGRMLAAAIKRVLPLDFDYGKVHLLGHSHGAKVATVAATEVHPAHLTLFDSPERFGPFARYANNKLYAPPYLPALPPMRRPKGTFVDNYYSCFGVCYNEQGGAATRPIVDVRLFPYSCPPNKLGCSHGYPMGFYRSAGGRGLGLRWSPLLGQAYATLERNYSQTWTSAGGDPLAMTNATACYDPPPIRGLISWWPRRTLAEIALDVKGAVMIGMARIFGSGEQRTFSLQGPENAFVRFWFQKNKQDDALMFAYDFEDVGHDDEVAVWVDDIRLIALRPLGRLDKGTAAVGLEDFEDGRHLLTLALYSQKGAKQVSIKKLVKLANG